MASKMREFHSPTMIKRSMQVRREEYLDFMTFQRNERPLFTEFLGPLIGVKEEWAEQGATPGELDFSAFRYRAPMDGHVPVNTGWMGGEEEKILEETADHVISRDRMGRLMKLFKSVATLPMPMDYPVSDMNDWKRIRHHYEFSEERFEKGWEKTALAHREAGRIVTINCPGGFDEPRQLLGEERLCIFCYEQPELIHDILKTIGDTACKVLERVSARIPVDQLNVHEDLAGKSGPLFGPRQVREFMTPYYQRIWSLLKSRGSRIFKQDSDGNMNSIIPDLLEAGINFMYPMEPAAGMDIVKIREAYGKRLAVMGGIDKHVLRESKEAILAELEYKIPPMVRTGGCILSLDHRITNGTPLENYRFYIEKVWEIMERETARP